MLYLFIIAILLLLSYHYDFCGNEKNKKKWYIGILMALTLFGTEIALLFHLENGSKLGLVIYSGITCIVAVVLTIVAFEKESNVKASGSRHSRVRVQSYNTTSRHRAPQRRHHATRPTRRGRR